MERYISINIHTELLHDNKYWQRTRAVLDCFSKNNIKATWFALNPSFTGYRAMDFDEKIWKERLKLLAQKNQLIEQHTHFYKGKEGIPKGEGYDLSKEHVLKRIREDREWLRGQGFNVNGFLSGAWRINREILEILAQEGYSYDLSVNDLTLQSNSRIEKINGLIELPAKASIKRLFLDLISLRPGRRFLKYNNLFLCTLHFHDFDLKDNLNYWLLKALISLSNIFGFKFITIREFLERNQSLRSL